MLTNANYLQIWNRVVASAKNIARSTIHFLLELPRPYSMRRSDPMGGPREE